MKKVMVVFGTRPEAIKMAPVVQALKATARISTQVVVTAQHREMLDQVLNLFGVVPDYDLNVMRPGQGLAELFSTVLTAMNSLIASEQPSLVVVHGDTSTATASALAAFYNQTGVAHVEAGLRTGNIMAPWPEEANRRLIASLSNIHFAPTLQARDNLQSERIASNTIHVTGNTVVDALLQAAASLEADKAMREAMDARFSFLDPQRRLVLVTGHRRENFGSGFLRICSALRTLATRPDVQIVYPVHLNPNVQRPVATLLANQPNISLIPPQDYLPFVYLMTRSALVITDSGGIQEEAPSLGKPVLVLRETTERPEAVAAGTVKLVGTNERDILEHASTLLDDRSEYARMARIHNPYGDGRAAQRIADLISKHLNIDGEG